MAANLRYMFKCMKLNLQKEAQYKTSFVLKIAMMCLNDAFFLIQWYIIFSLVPDICGYTFNEIMLIWAFSAGSFGVAHVFFEGAFNISHLIYNGKLDVFICQPKNLLINICCSSTSVSAFGDLLYAVVVAVIFAPQWWWIFVMIPLFFVGAIIYVSTYLIYVSLTFFIERGWALAEATQNIIISTSLYPMQIFSGIPKVILYSIIPAAYIATIPLMLFLSFNVWTLLVLLGVAAVVAFLAICCFYGGIKRYNSSSVLQGRS